MFSIFLNNCEIIITLCLQLWFWEDPTTIYTFTSLYLISALATTSRKPTSRLCIAIDVVRRAMEDRKCGLYRGDVYILAPRATKTYTFCSTVKEFLLTLIGNMEIADNISNHIFPITKLLSEPSCKIIKPITLDFNYIEVLPKGHFFNIEKKTFEVNPKQLRGSPRAFVLYDHTIRPPYPKPFIEGK